ncbi:hypothetical protein JHL17_23055 [Azospirillum sp. YIM B02556]|uniref:Uncharacterized protein n=1 Tax=Azospirillum endophyticum TaxID=2800326 RepID=A0ABS1FAM4_9PROT|nr:hypothetical protein [Azospirillum endophyticum]MBK1840287.1 hypothetical protein [Azospirillum endophyticum]
MDYRTVTLDKDREAAGRTILKLADEVGFETQAAAWLHLAEPNAWRFYLITSMIDEKGPKWIYERLLKFFAKVGLPKGITPLDIYIGSPSDKLFSQLPFSLDFEDEEGGLCEISDPSGNPDFLLDKGFFYRLRKQKIIARPNQFDLRVRQRLAA